VAEVLRDTEFNHGYTYSGHPVACAVALENLRILEEEGMIENVRDVTAPYLREKWEALADHPLVGEAKIVGMMASLALTPDKSTRAVFAAETGTAGFICRDRCFANNIIMRSVGDRMIISPPLSITCDEIDILIARARKSLDEAYEKLKADDLLKAG
jgi:putrescine aminotransferase